MNQKERNTLMRALREGTEDQAKAARAAWTRHVEVQNAREALWSFPQLCETLRREGNGRALSKAARAATCPRVVQKDDGTVQVFAWWDLLRTGGWAGKAGDPRPGAKATYAGPLAAYWRVTLEGDNV